MKSSGGVCSLILAFAVLGVVEGGFLDFVVRHGNWGSWGSWTACSVHQGTGINERSRACDNPAPNSFGHYCSGSSYENRQCRQGNWGGWGSWTTCSVSEGSGTNQRSRSCNNPAPNEFGAYCRDSGIESRECRHGNWADWSSWTACSVSEGTGNNERSRSCTNPAPNAWGKDCSGSSHESRECRHGNWGSWNAWSACSTTCNPGILERTRQCNNPPPNAYGDDCRDAGRETQPCHPPYNCSTFVAKVATHIKGSTMDEIASSRDSCVLRCQVLFKENCGAVTTESLPLDENGQRYRCKMSNHKTNDVTKAAERFTTYEFKSD